MKVTMDAFFGTARGQTRGGLLSPLADLLVLTACVFALVAPFAGEARADDDLPGRVGRVADVAGELFLAPQENPDQWVAVGINYPVTTGDNLWVGNDGRAEIDFGAGQFRLAGDTSLHLSRLDDRQFALFVAQGRVSVRVRVLDPGETARVDTPNAQVVLNRPGLYRIDVSDDREHTQLVVREGEANVVTPGAVQQVLPGQTASVDGPDPRYADVRNGIGTDGFDAWVATRDRFYAGARAGNYVSPQMVGAADLDRYGTWSQVPEYGAVWYPQDVAPDWAPYRDGYWAEVGAWGPTWVDAAPWGYAPFHYGRWSYIRGRWGWCPGAYVARPLWAPALVGWTGGPGWGLSVSVGAPVYGWVPLAWGEPYRPWWGHCSNGCWNRYNRPYAVNVVVVRPNSPPPTRYVNWNAPGGMTAVSGSALISRRPVHDNLVVVPRGSVTAAPVLASAPLVRSEPGRIPTRQIGNGAPPPASTFYPTTARPLAIPSTRTGPGAAPGTSSQSLVRQAPSAPGNASAYSRPGTPTAVMPTTRQSPPAAAPGAVPGTSSQSLVRQAPSAPGNASAYSRPGTPTAVMPTTRQPSPAAAPGTSSQSLVRQAPSAPGNASAYSRPGTPTAVMPTTRQSPPAASPATAGVQTTVPTMRSMPQPATAMPSSPRQVQAPAPAAIAAPPATRSRSAPATAPAALPPSVQAPRGAPAVPSVPMVRSAPAAPAQAATPTSRVAPAPSSTPDAAGTGNVTRKDARGRDGVPNNDPAAPR